MQTITSQIRKEEVILCEVLGPGQADELVYCLMKKSPVSTQKADPCDVLAACLSEGQHQGELDVVCLYDLYVLFVCPRP